ncbi:DUF6421 family protein [Frankia sp. AiPa1]|nr:DUF6421 family protein [Frankia sp. AiPa1]
MAQVKSVKSFGRVLIHDQFDRPSSAAIESDDLVAGVSSRLDHDGLVAKLRQGGFECSPLDLAELETGRPRAADILIVSVSQHDDREPAGNGPATLIDRRHARCLLRHVEDGGGLVLFLPTAPPGAAHLGLPPELLDLLTVPAAEFFHRDMDKPGEPGMPLQLDLFAHCLTRPPCAGVSAGIGGTIRRDTVDHPLEHEAHHPVTLAGHGAGRVAVVADPCVFERNSLRADYADLALNLVWAVMPRQLPVRMQRPQPAVDVYEALRESVEGVRRLQDADGAIGRLHHASAWDSIRLIAGQCQQLAALMPYQAEYLDAVRRCLETWAGDGFGRLTFDEALRAYTPQKWRSDGMEHVAILPLSTPNGSPGTRFEALHLRCIWPDWLAEVNSHWVKNETFVPCELISHTGGYDSECAVLFPSSVPTQAHSQEFSHFGIILCSREAKRFVDYVLRACALLDMDVPPDLAWMLFQPDIVTVIFALWDLVHDKSHFIGHMPLVPFTEGVRQPFWMGAIEELRVDLVSFQLAQKLLVSAQLQYARMMQYAILFDRTLRFPVVGLRVRNYDSLAGQILMGRCLISDSPPFAYQDGAMRIDWPAVASAFDNLLAEIDELYRSGLAANTPEFWHRAHKFVARYVPPALESKWSSERFELDDGSQDSLIGAVLDDEFPLNVLYTRVLHRLAEWETSSRPRSLDEGLRA